MAEGKDKKESIINQTLVKELLTDKTQYSLFL